MKMPDMHILVLEDDDFQRRMVANMCRSLEPAYISEAADGQQALQIIRGEGAEPVNVVLCDLQMPGMDGMEFLRHLSEEHSDVGIVITSALDGNLLASVGRMAKVYGIKLLGVVEKPIVLAHLKEILTTHDGEEGKWQLLPADAKNFTLDEILQGIDANQFQPFFQPKVDLKSGRLIGAEALARWIHPEHGVVLPYAFIPLLERSGNIDDLTFRLLEQSAAACRALHENGHTITIAVNLSLTSLSDSALAGTVIQLVQKAGLDPHYMVLEITESAAMTDTARALENLTRLCMHGFTLAIDDYGTGYSSMQQLTRIPFGELKIDQSFIKDFTDNKSMGIVVESSIDMAHKLRIKSVAEGIETQQDWERLKTLGCDIGQGYFIAEPMALQNFHDFIDEYAHKPTTPLRPGRMQGTINILVVEDDHYTRKLIERVLHDLGYSNITGAKDAETAIKQLQTNSYDLIISDIDMPGMNGLQLIQMIRSGKTLAKPETRIVVLTALSQTEILGSAMALDINGFLVKPLIPAVVDEKISLAMSERLHIRQPMAYMAIRTDFKGLPSHVTDAHTNAAITLGNPAAEHGDGGRNAYRIPVNRLRPGMVLKGSIYLTNGTLILASGQKLTETSINRLNDISSFLKDKNILVQES